MRDSQSPLPPSRLYLFHYWHVKPVEEEIQTIPGGFPSCACALVHITTAGPWLGQQGRSHGRKWSDSGPQAALVTGMSKLYTEEGRADVKIVYLLITHHMWSNLSTIVCAGMCFCVRGIYRAKTL